MNKTRAYRTAGFIALAVIFLASAAPDSGAAKSQGSSRKGKGLSAEASAAGPDALSDAVSGLSDFSDRASKFTADEWNFVLGYAAFRRGDFKGAGELFSKSAGKLPAVGDHVLYYRAASANRLGKPGDALALLDELRAFGGDSVWSSEALLERGRALSSMGRGGEARALLSDYRRRAGPVGAFEADKIWVSSYVREGDPSAASQLKRLAVTADCEARLLELDPLMAEVKSRFGEDVASWLEETPQQTRLAESFAAASQWDEVASRMEKLLSSRRLGGGQLSEARWLLARALRWIHRYDEAISLMEGLLRDPNAGHLAGSVMNTLAITYAKKDDYAKAIELRKRMMDGSPPGSARAAEMAYKIAFLVMDEGRYDEAIGLWRKFLDTRGGGRRDAAEWYLAWSHYMAGRHAEAAALFEAMQKGGRGGKIKDRLKYWRGRALEKDGRAAEARAAFASVAREHPA
nr:tetratricopeptide repeat protein [bacterium]